jgi:ABC-type polysaccharide/polyol phosphate transport system ATPase subunit
MLSIVGKDIHVEFRVYDHHMRSLKHQLGIGHLAKSINRFATRKLNVGGQIDTGATGGVVIKALEGINFEFHEGDRVGLLGHNGSGKTTLLRTLAGIYEPISGEIRANARVVPLFDLQLGMDVDATGLENIWLRSKLLGLTSRQINSSIEDIAEFTELGDFLYMPIRTYSMGMMLRLAFAISTAITPEILVLDEMIGAGDAAFIARANDRLKDFLAKAGILVLASHNLPMLTKWCNKGLLLEHGKLIAFGPLADVVARYQGPELSAAQAADSSPSFFLYHDRK